MGSVDAAAAMEKIRAAGLLRTQGLIGGKWVDAYDGKTLEVQNPATGEVLANVACMGNRETSDAIASANTTFYSWSKLTASERSKALRKWHDLLISHKEELALLMTLEQGKPMKEALGEVNYGASFIEYFAEEAKRVYGDIIPPTLADRRILVLKQPIGVVGAITPWNFPLAMITRKVGPALASGCTVVVKPSEFTPLTALAAADLALQAGIPAGALNVVMGNAPEIGDALTQSTQVRKITFTGSTAVGKKLLAGSANTVKKVSLELGGNAPCIVFDDADIEVAVKGSLAAKFRNSGQTCVCANRILVQEGIYEKFASAFVKAVQSLQVGNGLEESTSQGPLINEAAVQKVEKFVDDATSKGANIILGPFNSSLLRPPSSGMDGASSSASSSGYRPRRGVRLRPLRRRRGPASSLASRGGDGDGGENGGGGAQDDLALPLGMSFAAVLARVVNSSNGPGERLHPVILSKICTSAVKESLANTYGDRFDSFMRNFENSFSSTLRTLHRINEIPDYERSPAPECSFKHGGSAALGNNLSTVDSQNRTHEVIVSSVESQLVLYARDSQQLAQSARSRSNHEADRSILNAFERSVKEQARSNELKEFEIGLNMRKLQLKQSQLALSSYTHMLEKIKLSLGFQKASFQGEKFQTKMQDTRDAQILRTLTDFLVSAVIIMSVFFAYGTYNYSYERITDITSACSAASRGSKSWWVPSSVSNLNSGLLFIRCHLIAATRMFFGIVMILAIAWLAFQRSALTGSSMPVTFNFILLGVICGFAGRFCTNTLGGDGNVWLMCWEILCSIHLLGNCYPSILYRILHGPITTARGNEVVWLPYWIRRCIFYAVLGFVVPTFTGLLPFASVSDWKDHFSDQIKTFIIGDKVED